MTSKEIKVCLQRLLNTTATNTQQRQDIINIVDAILENKVIDDKSKNSSDIYKLSLDADIDDVIIMLNKVIDKLNL